MKNARESPKRKFGSTGNIVTSHAKCSKKTFKKSYGNVIVVGGYRICGLKSPKGFLCWVNQGDETGTHFRHTQTKIHKRHEDAYYEAVSQLENMKDRQLELF